MSTFSARLICRPNFRLGVFLVPLLLDACSGDHDSGQAITNLTITKLSRTSAAPAATLTITGQGFITGSTVSIRFADAAGFQADVRSINHGPSQVTVAVPAYFNKSAGVFGTGAVSISALQTTGSTTTASNSISGFTILPLPALTLAPGSIAANVAGFLELSLVAMSKRLGELDRSTSGGIDAAALAPAFDAQAKQYGLIKTALRASIANPGRPQSLGMANGVTFALDAAALQQADQWLLAVLNAAGEDLGVAAATAPAGGYALTADAACATNPQICNNAGELLYGMKMVDGGELVTTQRYQQLMVPAARDVLADLSAKFGAASAAVVAGVTLAGASIPVSVVALLTTANLVTLEALMGMDASMLVVNSGDKVAAKNLLETFESGLMSVYTGVVSPLLGAISTGAGVAFDLYYGLKPVVEAKIPAWIAQAKAYAKTSTKPPPVTSTDEIFVGTFSGPMGGATSLDGCQYAVTASGTMTLTITTRSDNTVTATLDAPTEFDIVVTYSPQYVSCTGSPFSVTPSGAVTVTGTSLSGTIQDTNEVRPATVVFDGTRSGTSISALASVSREFYMSGTSGDSVITLTGDMSPFTLTKN